MRIIYTFLKCISFWSNSLCGKLEGLVPVNQFNNTSWKPFVTPTDRPKSIRNRCVIEVFESGLVLSIVFWIFCWYKDFCHRILSDNFLFLFNRNSEFLTILQ